MPHPADEDRDLFREYFNALPCYLTVQDRDLRVTRANRLFIADFGEPQGRRCFELYKEQDEPCEQCPVLASFEDGQRHRAEGRVHSLDGRQLSTIVRTTPIRDQAGDISEVLSMAGDITEIKRLQRELQTSQERYQRIFDEVPCFISIQDRDLRVVEANRRFKEAFGDVVGVQCYELYKHRDEQCLRCPVQETFADGKVHHSEEVVTAKSGQRINTMVYSAPIRDPDGNTQSVMEMSADITPIRELQSQLESIGLLISSVSHGVRGLLNGLDGGMYLLRTAVEKNKPERLGQGLEMVQRNVDRIRSMVMNILYHAKERTPERVRLSAFGLGEEVVSLVRPEAERLGVELLAQLDPAAGELHVDYEAMRSLLVNLAENALDACRVERDRPNHRVEFSVSGDETKVVYEVTDNGIGMDRETREKAFSVFFTSKGVKGTGLGLFIANNIAKAHGGSLSLESTPGEGTRVRVEVPRRSRDEPPLAGERGSAEDE